MSAAADWLIRDAELADSAVLAALMTQLGYPHIFTGHGEQAGRGPFGLVLCDARRGG